MSVKQITGMGPAYDPVDRFQAAVSLALVVMDAEGRRVGDENIQRPPITDPIPEKADQELCGAAISLHLGVLVDTIGPIADGAPKACEQKAVAARASQIQVGAALRPSVCKSTA